VSPLLLLILLRSRDRNHVLEELSDVKNDSCSRMCRGLALACLSILMLHIPEACTRIAESLLDVSCIIFTQGIEFFRDYFILSASTAFLDESNSARHSLFNLERQNSIQAFSDAYGDQQQGLISFYSLECIKEAAGAAVETGRSVVQLIASLINIMLRRSGHGNTEGSASSDCAFLCIEKLIDENTDLVPSISLCLLAPVAAWLHYLAHTTEIDWLAVSTACNLWNAAAASVISNTDATILDSHTQDSSVSSSLELLHCVELFPCNLLKISHLMSLLPLTTVLLLFALFHPPCLLQTLAPTVLPVPLKVQSILLSSARIRFRRMFDAGLC